MRGTIVLLNIAFKTVLLNIALIYMVEINNTTKQKINCRAIAAKAENLLRDCGLAGAEVSLAIIGSARMRRLNREYRGFDKATDVLSFPSGRLKKKFPLNSGKARKASVFPGQAKALKASAAAFGRLKKKSLPGSAKFPADNLYLGEVIVNIDDVGRPGKYRDIFGSPAVKSSYLLDFLVIHGLLHLVGYDDKSAEARQEMISLGRKFLE